MNMFGFALMCTCNNALFVVELIVLVIEEKTSAVCSILGAELAQGSLSELGCRAF